MGSRCRHAGPFGTRQGINEPMREGEEWKGEGVIVAATVGRKQGRENGGHLVGLWEGKASTAQTFQFKVTLQPEEDPAVSNTIRDLLGMRLVSQGSSGICTWCRCLCIHLQLTSSLAPKTRYTLGCLLHLCYLRHGGQGEPCHRGFLAGF